MISKPKILKNNVEIVEKTDLEGQTVKVAEAKGKWLDENTFMNSDGTVSSKDPNMVMRQIHNTMNEPIFFTKMHPHLIGADKIMINEDCFSILPHAYYVGTTKSGKPLTFTQYLGKDINLGRRTNK